MELGVARVYRCGNHSECDVTVCPHYRLHPKLVHPGLCGTTFDCLFVPGCQVECQLEQDRLLSRKPTQLEEALKVAQDLWGYWDGNVLISRYPGQQEDIQEAFERLIRILSAPSHHRVQSNNTDV